MLCDIKLSANMFVSLSWIYQSSMKGMSLDIFIFILMYLFAEFHDNSFVYN